MVLLVEMNAVCAAVIIRLVWIAKGYQMVEPRTTHVECVRDVTSLVLGVIKYSTVEILRTSVAYAVETTKRAKTAGASPTEAKSTVHAEYVAGKKRRARFARMTLHCARAVTALPKAEKSKICAVFVVATERRVWAVMVNPTARLYLTNVANVAAMTAPALIA
jgi:hypothetical protein